MLLGKNWEIFTWILALTAASLRKAMLWKGIFTGGAELMTCHIPSAPEQGILDFPEPPKPVLYSVTPVRHSAYHGRFQPSLSWN